MTRVTHSAKNLQKAAILLGCALVCLFAGCRHSALPGEADTLRKLLNTAQEEMDAPARNRLLDSVNTSLLSRGNDSITRLLNQIVAWHYSDNGNRKKAVVVTRRFYKMAAEKNDSLRMAHGLYYMGDYHYNESDNDSAFYYYTRAGRMFFSQHDTLNAARTIENNMSILYSTGSYAQVEAQSAKALKLYKKINDNELIFDSYLSLGLSLLQMKNYDKAREYFSLALKQADVLEKEGFPEEKIMLSKAACYNNLGLMHEYKREYSKAISYYNKVLAMPNLQRDLPAVYAMQLSNRGYSNMLMHNTGGTVVNDLYESMHIWDSLKDKPGIITGEIRFGEFLLMKRDTATALDYLKKGYAGAKSIQSSLDILHSLNVLALADRQKTSYYSSLYFKVNDSLQQAERSAADKFARIAYETDDVKKQNKILHRRFNYILFAGIAVLLLTAGFLIILRLRVRNRELLYQQDQQRANEKIYTLLLQQESEAEKAKMQERNRIATSLNEGIMARIFTMGTRLATLDTGENSRKQLLVNELQETRNGIGKLSHDLKESFLSENESFTAALKSLLLQQEETSAIAFNLHIDPAINRTTVTVGQRIALFRIVQEACTNAKKYSGAKHCYISLSAEGMLLRLHIEDDGRGFDPKKQKEGIGLRNIRERAEALGGSFHNLSAPGKGTVLDIIV